MISTMAAHRAIVPALRGALSVYDGGTARHSARVAVISELMAAHLGLSAEEREELWWAATLHDLGKLAIPAEVINKPGPLDVGEWEQIHQHPTIGADILVSLSPRLKPIAEAIRAHHERWDGGGYPGGIGEEEIPLHGRIISLADVFDSTTSPRPYRKGRFTVTEALQLVHDEAGKYFDPRLAPIFVRLIREQRGARGGSRRAKLAAAIDPQPRPF